MAPLCCELLALPPLLCLQLPSCAAGCAWPLAEGASAGRGCCTWLCGTGSSSAKGPGSGSISGPDRDLGMLPPRWRNLAFAWLRGDPACRPHSAPTEMLSKPLSTLNWSTSLQHLPDRATPGAGRHSRHCKMRSLPEHTCSQALSCCCSVLCPLSIGCCITVIEPSFSPLAISGPEHLGRHAGNNTCHQPVHVQHTIHTLASTCMPGGG